MKRENVHNLFWRKPVLRVFLLLLVPDSTPLVCAGDVLNEFVADTRAAQRGVRRSGFPPRRHCPRHTHRYANSAGSVGPFACNNEGENKEKRNGLLFPCAPLSIRRHATLSRALLGIAFGTASPRRRRRDARGGSTSAVKATVTSHPARRAPLTAVRVRALGRGHAGTATSVFSARTRARPRV